MRIGICGAEVADEVEAAAADERVEGCGRRTRAPSARSRSCWRGVKTRESRPRWRSWRGGSSKMIEPGGIYTPLLISSRTVPRAELYVFQSTEAALDVVEAAQRVEVVALVVVERLLVAEPLPDRVRVRVDLEVVRVVVDVGSGALGFGSHPVTTNRALLRLPARACASRRTRAAPRAWSSDCSTHFEVARRRSPRPARSAARGPAGCPSSCPTRRAARSRRRVAASSRARAISCSCGTTSVTRPTS